MLSKVVTNGKTLALSLLKRLRLSKMEHKEGSFDTFLTEKFKYFGFNHRIAYAVVTVNALGFLLYQLIYSDDNYNRRFALNYNGENRFFKYLTCHFANNNPYILGASLPLLLLIGRKIELLYGSALFLKLTMFSLCMNGLSLRLARHVPETKLPIQLPKIDQVSKDGKYQMGPHGLLASYAAFGLLKLLRGNIWIVIGLAVADTVLSQRGYWGGYLGGILAYLVF